MEMISRTLRRLAPAAPLIAVAAVLLMGAIPRCYDLPGGTIFSPDQGRDATVVWDFINRGVIPLLGPPVSTGAYQRGPAFYYLLAPGFLLSGGWPVGGSATTVFLDLGAIALLISLGRRLGGLTAGLAAGALWATSPFLAAMARSIWNPQDVPFFELLAMLSLVEVSRGRPRWFLAVLPSLSIAWQLHDQGILLVPPLVLWWLIVRPRVPWRVVAGSIALAVVVTGPFLWYEVNHGFQDLTAMFFQALGGGNGSHASHPALADQVNQMILGLSAPMPGGLLAVILWLAAFAGLVWCAWGLRKPDRAVPLLLLLVGATVFVYPLWPVKLQVWYLYILMPLPFLGVGACLAWLWGFAQHLPEGWRSWSGRVAAAALSLVVVATTLSGASTAMDRARVSNTNGDAVENLQAHLSGISDAAGGRPFAVRLVSGAAGFQAFESPYVYMLNLMYGPVAARADVDTYVLFTPASLAPPGSVSVAPGAAVVHYDAPSIGSEEFVANGNFAAPGAPAANWELDGAAATVVQDGATSCLRVAGRIGDPPNPGPAATQRVSVKGGARYLLSFEYRTDAQANVLARVYDVYGGLVAIGQAAGLRRAPAHNWTRASMFVDVQGNALAVEIRLGASAGGADFRDVSLRVVESEKIPGVVVR